MNYLELRINDFDSEDCQLVTNSQDIEAVLDCIGYHGLETIGHLFVKAEDGEYSEVYASRYGIPWLTGTYAKLV